MGKDPAVLFYTSDFLSGTFTMTDDQVGKYIRLLCLQHQKGKLTEKDMLHICKTYDFDIWNKFIKDGEHFYNKKMLDETERRQKYSESRKNNRNSTKSDTYVNTYVKHMETETETETKNKTKTKSNSQTLFSETEYLNIEKFKEAFVGTQYEAANFEYYHEVIKNWSDSKGEKKLSWIATAKNWMARDLKDGKFIHSNYNPNEQRINQNSKLSYAEREAIKRNSL